MESKITISKIEEFQMLISSKIACLFYFSTNSCSVGEALDIKVQSLVQAEFPKMNFYYVDLNSAPELSAFYSVFVEPTILVFFEGKESFRKSRHIGMLELKKSIQRPYDFIFDNSL